MIKSREKKIVGKLTHATKVNLAETSYVTELALFLATNTHEFTKTDISKTRASSLLALSSGFQD